MGLFSRLKLAPVSTTSPYSVDGIRPAWMQQGAEAMLYTGSDELEVVGEAFYQDNLWSIVGRRSEYVRASLHALLVAEEGNPHDPNAVSVWIGGNLVGYLNRSDAKRLRPGLISLVKRTRQPVALSATIAGGGPRPDDRTGNLGVWLAYDPADFGS